MKESITNDMLSACGGKLHDAKVKKLLSNKDVLSYIVADFIDDFKGMKPKEIKELIEGAPYVGSVPVDAGLTNIQKSRGKGNHIVGMNTENVEINEGMVKFDVLFYIRTKDGLSKIIVNIEAQNERTPYPIYDRALYYASRLISSQKQREFTGMNYDEIKDVHCIWLRFNAKEEKVRQYYTVYDEGNGFVYDKRFDKLKIYEVDIPAIIPPPGGKHVSVRLISTFFSELLEVIKKMDIIKAEYEISNCDELEEDVFTMCNLSEGIFVRGYEKGVSQGISQIVQSMHKEGCTPQVIARLTGIDINMIDEIIGKHNC